MLTIVRRQWLRQIHPKRFYSIRHQLKPFYMLVHPDLFHNHPEKQKVNEESLKIFHSYINDDYKSKYNVTLNFHVKQDDEYTFHAKINVNSTMSAHSLIQNVLKACRLPHNASVYYEKQDKSKHNQIWKTMNSQSFEERFVARSRDKKFAKMNTFEETNLHAWLLQHRNQIIENQMNGNLRKQEYDEIVDRFQRKYCIKGIVVEQRRYSYATVIRALRHFENLIDREIIGVEKLLQGILLKFDRFDGLDQTGRFLLNVHAVPGDWKQALLSLQSSSSSVSNIKVLEKSISDICFGIKLATRRQGGSFPAKHYERSLKYLYDKLKEECFLREAESFNDLIAVFDRESDLYDVTQEGYLLFHPYMQRETLFQYCSMNYQSIKKKRSKYLKGLREEHEELERCKEYCKLHALEREQHLTSSQVLHACRKLVSLDGNLLDNKKLVISNYYSVSTDGYVRIPWNFRMSSYE